MLNKIFWLGLLCAGLLPLTASARDSLNAQATCKIRLAKYVVILSLPITQLDQQQLLSRSHCSPEISALLFEKLPTLRGKVNAHFWDQLKPKTAHTWPEIIFEPSHPHIIQLEDFWKKIAPTRVAGQMLQVQTSQRLLFIDNEEHLSVERLSDLEREQGLQQNLQWYALKSSSQGILAQMQWKTAETAKGQLVWKRKQQCSVQSSKLQLQELMKAQCLEQGWEEIADGDFFQGTPETFYRWELRTNLKPGEALRTSQLRARRMVRAGDMVKGLLNTPQLSLEMTLRSLGGGSQGDQIWVEHPKHKKKMMATIKGDNLVELSL